MENKDFTEKKFLDRALLWAKCHEAVSFLLQNEMIYHNEYEDVRRRMIEKFCSDEVE